MSNLIKKGFREQKLREDKKVKKHVKAFYQIIGKIDNISKQLDPSIEYNEENINKYVNPILGRDLDSMEKFLILGKLHHANETTDNI